MQNIFFKRFREIDGEVVVGIDEAGRGPVLGYMVYGALVACEGCPELACFSDSKTMSAHSREAQFETIEAGMSFAYKAIHPQQLTERMMCYGENLNIISFKTVFDILDEVHNAYNVNTVFVDTVGDPAKYRAMLETRYRSRFVVEANADSRYKVVSGASIVAKVLRDHLLRVLDSTCGSGYPGDPLTREWLKRTKNPVFGYPSIVRFSWATVDEFLPKKRASRMQGTFEGFYLSDS
eukprot:jgi/Antlo1/32/762